MHFCTYSWEKIIINSYDTDDKDNNFFYKNYKIKTKILNKSR